MNIKYVIASGAWFYTWVAFYHINRIASLVFVLVSAIAVWVWFLLVREYRPPSYFSSPRAEMDLLKAADLYLARSKGTDNTTYKVKVYYVEGMSVKAIAAARLLMEPYGSTTMGEVYGITVKLVTRQGKPITGKLTYKKKSSVRE